MPFESPEIDLEDMLRDVGTGRLQLPDFQREWKWDDDRIRALLASVSLGYPMGVVMTLEVSGHGAGFKPRPLTGVARPTAHAAEQLILDGQQRLTSLFQALASGRPVDTVDSRNKRLRRWYYIDIQRAVTGPEDREDAIISVPEDRIERASFGRVVTRDLSSGSRECEAGIFPLHSVFDLPTKWLLDYTRRDQARIQVWQEFEKQVLEKLRKYRVPVIKLTHDTPKAAVCTVFKKVNTGGVELDDFELLTATFAGDRSYSSKHEEDFRLNDDWKRIQSQLREFAVLRGLKSTHLLQAIALVTTWTRRERFIREKVTRAEHPVWDARVWTS